MPQVTLNEFRLLQSGAMTSVAQMPAGPSYDPNATTQPPYVEGVNRDVRINRAKELLSSKQGGKISQEDMEALKQYQQVQADEAARAQQQAQQPPPPDVSILAEGGKGLARGVLRLGTSVLGTLPEAAGQLYARGRDMARTGEYANMQYDMQGNPYSVGSQMTDAQLRAKRAEVAATPTPNPFQGAYQAVKGVMRPDRPSLAADPRATPENAPYIDGQFPYVNVGRPQIARLAGEAGELVPQVAPIIGATMATGGLGAVPAIVGGISGGALEGLSEYEQAIDRGEKPQEAFRQLAVTGLGAGALNMIPLGRFGRILPERLRGAFAERLPRIMQGRLASGGVVGLLEGATETAEGGVSAIARMQSIPQTQEEFWSAVEDVANGVWDERSLFLVSALFGGGMGVVGKDAEIRGQRNAAEREAEMRRQAQEEARRLMEEEARANYDAQNERYDSAWEQQAQDRRWANQAPPQAEAERLRQEREQRAAQANQQWEFNRDRNRLLGHLWEEPKTSEQEYEQAWERSANEASVARAEARAAEDPNFKKPVRTPEQQNQDRLEIAEIALKYGLELDDARDIFMRGIDAADIREKKPGSFSESAAEQQAIDWIASRYNVDRKTAKDMYARQKENKYGREQTGNGPFLPIGDPAGTPTAEDIGGRDASATRRMDIGSTAQAGGVDALRERATRQLARERLNRKPPDDNDQGGGGGGTPAVKPTPTPPLSPEAAAPPKTAKALADTRKSEKTLANTAREMKGKETVVNGQKAKYTGFYADGKLEAEITEGEQAGRSELVDAPGATESAPAPQAPAKQSAEFVGWQERPKKPPVALYNIPTDTGGKSTVSAETARQQGFDVPEPTTPAPPTPAPESKAKALADERTKKPASPLSKEANRAAMPEAKGDTNYEKTANAIADASKTEGLFDKPKQAESIEAEARSLKGKEGYWNGDRITYTGEVQDGFLVFRFEEGPKKGKTGMRAGSAEKEKRAETEKERHRREQEGFARLHKNKAAEQAPKQTAKDLADERAGKKKEEKGLVARSEPTLSNTGRTNFHFEWRTRKLTDQEFYSSASEYERSRYGGRWILEKRRIDTDVKSGEQVDMGPEMGDWSMVGEYYDSEREAIKNNLSNGGRGHSLHLSESLSKSHSDAIKLAGEEAEAEARKVKKEQDEVNARNAERAANREIIDKQVAEAKTKRGEVGIALTDGTKKPVTANIIGKYAYYSSGTKKNPRYTVFHTETGVSLGSRDSISGAKEWALRLSRTAPDWDGTKETMEVAGAIKARQDSVAGLPIPEAPARELAKKRGEQPPTPDPAALRADIIRQALDINGGKRETRVRLADLRDRLAGYDREAVDAMLRQMQTDGEVNLYHVDDPQDVTPRDIAASLRLDGKPPRVDVTPGAHVGDANTRDFVYIREQGAGKPKGKAAKLADERKATPPFKGTGKGSTPITPKNATESPAAPQTAEALAEARADIKRRYEAGEITLNQVAEEQRRLIGGKKKRATRDEANENIRKKREKKKKKEDQGGYLNLGAIAAIPNATKAAVKAMKAFVAGADPTWTNTKGLGRAVHRARVKMLGEIGSYTMRAAQANRDFEKAIKKLYGSRQKMPDDVAKTAYEVLEGKKGVNSLPEALQAPVAEMRHQIDAISSALIRSGLLNEKQKATFSKNLGTYVRRTYKAFNDPNWAKNMPQEVRNRMYSFLSQEKGSDGKLLYTSKNQIEQKMKEILWEAQNTGQFMQGARGTGMLGKMDLSTLKKRLDLPEPYLAFLGEEQDAQTGFLESIHAASHMLAQYRFLDETKKVMTGIKLWEYNDPNIDPNAVPVSDHTNPTYGPLAGMKGDEKFIAALKEAVEGRQLSGALMYLAEGNGLFKSAKTVYSPKAIARNYGSNILIAGLNGHLTGEGVVNDAKKAHKIAFAGFTKGGTKAQREFYDEAIRRGVVQDSNIAEELKELRRRIKPGSAFGKVIDKIPGGQNVRQGWGDINEVATDFYQMGDDIFKLYAFMREVRIGEKAGLPSEQAMDEAAWLVRATYPTYSENARWVQRVRQMVVVGPFTGFVAEAPRIYVNSMLRAAHEMSSKNPVLRRNGMKRAVSMALATGFPATMAGLTGMALGIGSDDRDDIARFAAPWSKYSALAYLKADRANGIFHVVDTGAQDPHAYLKAPIYALLRGDTTLEGIKAAATELAGPYLQNEIAFAAFAKVFASMWGISNKDALWNQSDPFIEKAEKAAFVIYEAGEPGAIADPRRAYKRGGVPELLKEPFYMATGTHVSKIDIPKSLSIMANGFKKLTSELRDVHAEARSGSKAGVEEQMRQLEVWRKANFEKLVEARRAAERLGVEYNAIVDALRGGGLTIEETKRVLYGDDSTPSDEAYRPYEPTRTLRQKLLELE